MGGTCTSKKVFGTDTFTAAATLKFSGTPDKNVDKGSECRVEGLQGGGDNKSPRSGKIESMRCAPEELPKMPREAMVMFCFSPVLPVGAG
jgi:hypothetical protein